MKGRFVRESRGVLGKNKEFEFEKKNRELLKVKRRLKTKERVLNFTNRFGKDQRFDCDLQNQESDFGGSV